MRVPLLLMQNLKLLLLAKMLEPLGQLLVVAIMPEYLKLLLLELLQVATTMPESLRLQLLLATILLNALIRNKTGAAPSSHRTEEK